MSELTETLKYLQGLCDGKELDKQEGEGKILSELVKLTGKLSAKVDYLEDQLEDVSMFKDEMIAELEDADEFLRSMIMGSKGELPFLDHDDDFDDSVYFNELFDDEEEEDEDFYDVTCQKCGKTFKATYDDFDEDDVICPFCGSNFELSEDFLKTIGDSDHHHD